VSGDGPKKGGGKPVQDIRKGTSKKMVKGGWKNTPVKGKGDFHRKERTGGTGTEEVQEGDETTLVRA